MLLEARDICLPENVIQSRYRFYFDIKSQFCLKLSYFPLPLSNLKY